MPGIGDRIGEWVDDRAQEWKGRLAGWVLSWAIPGVGEAVKSLTIQSREATRATLTAARDNAALPKELTELIDYYLQPGTPGGFLLDLVSTVVGVLQVTGALGQPPANLVGYWQERRLRTTRLDPELAIRAWRRKLASVPVPLDDLRDQGWSEQRIKALQDLSEIIPGVQDLIRMSVREAFSPEIAAKFGQYQDPPTAVYPWADKIGLSQEWVDRYWAAHWDLPSATQGIEMLRRGVIDDATFQLLLRALDVMPYWRDKLTAISWAVPTRVDVRRFWDMRTISETRMREIYTSLGYHGKDLDDYVLWTKVYTAFPDLLARYKNGWITLEMVQAELVALGMAADRAQEMIQEKIKKAAPERVAAERDLTRTDIINGVKKAVITYTQGVELLQAIGYDAEEANYILTVAITTAGGSPETYAEFLELVQGWRRAVGLSAKQVTEELKVVAKEVVRLTDEVKRLEAALKAEESAIHDITAVAPEVSAHLTQSRLTLHAAQVELARAQAAYNTLLAQWRHQA